MNNNADCEKRAYMVPEKAFGNLLWAVHLLRRKAGFENIRFFSNPGMSFSSREVERIQLAGCTDDSGDGQPEYKVFVNTGGLCSDAGPLPLWFDELLAQEDIDDAPVGDFLDLFSNRFVGLLYAAWRANNIAISYEPTGKDPVSQVLFSILGISDTQEKTSLEPDPARLLGYAGTLGQRPRSAMALECLLKSYFPAVPIRIRECIKKMIRISNHQRCRLGQQGSTLGDDMHIGERIADISGQFRIEIGPLDLESFETFLPLGRCHDSLVRLVTLYVSYSHGWDIALRIKSDSIPLLRLGDKKHPGTRLGYTSWLVTQPRKEATLQFNPLRRQSRKKI
jgi:type VI secretion system protein ImpH